MGTATKKAEDLSAQQLNILSAMDADWRTLPGIKKFLKIPAMEDISGDISVLVNAEIIKRLTNDDGITAFFRFDQKPKIFWKAKDGTIAAEYAKSFEVAETPEPVEETEKLEKSPNSNKREIEVSAADVKLYASQGFMLTTKTGAVSLQEKLKLSYNGLYNKFGKFPELKTAYKEGLAIYEESLKEVPPEKEIPLNINQSAAEQIIMNAFGSAPISFNDLLNQVNLGGLFIPALQSLMSQGKIVKHEQADEDLYSLAVAEAADQSQNLSPESPVIEANDAPAQTPASEETIVKDVPVYKATPVEEFAESMQTPASDQSEEILPESCNNFFANQISPAEIALARIFGVTADLIEERDERQKPNKVVELAGYGKVEIYLDYDPFKTDAPGREFINDLVGLCGAYEREELAAKLSETAEKEA